MTTTPPKKANARWGVYMLREKGQRLGTVDAKDRDDAVRKAISEFEIREADRWRITVQRE